MTKKEIIIGGSILLWFIITFPLCAFIGLKVVVSLFI